MNEFLAATVSIAEFFKSHPVLFWGFTIPMTLLSFIFFAIDKVRAIDGVRRISEATLLLFCFCGGAVGGLLGMILCRHKIRKPKFYLTVPFLATLQILFILFMYFKELII